MKRAWMWYTGAFAWGLAEAMVFFVVPDVLITAAALRSRKRALLCCVTSIAGAVLGGAVMYLWGRHDPRAMHALLLHIPAIGPALIEHAHASLQQLGGLALLGGTITGVPYKLFAAQAAFAGFSLPALLLWTVPARGLRFVLLALLTHALAGWLRKFMRPRVVIGIWALAWIVNYALYWSLMPS